MHCSSKGRLYYSFAAVIFIGMLITAILFSQSRDLSQLIRGKERPSFEDLQKRIDDMVGTTDPMDDEAYHHALQVVGDYAQRMVDQHGAKSCEVNDNSVTIEFEDGFIYAYTPVHQEDTTSIQAYPMAWTGANNAHASLSTRITTLQPELTTQFPADLTDFLLATVDNPAMEIEQYRDYYVFDTNRDDAEVDLGWLKAMPHSALWIWSGHGGYTKKLHAFMATGTPITTENDHLYHDDLTAGRVMWMSSGDYGITAEFVKTYWNAGQFTGSLVYLSTCSSAADSVLADTFLSCGAATVIGNSSTTYTLYTSHLLSETLRNMTKADSNGLFRTANDALSSAKEIYGASDGLGSTAVLSGNLNFRLFDEGALPNLDASPKVLGTLARSIADIKPLKGNVSAYLVGDLYGLVLSDGTIVTEPIYTTCWVCRNCYQAEENWGESSAIVAISASTGEAYFISADTGEVMGNHGGHGGASGSYFWDQASQRMRGIDYAEGTVTDDQATSSGLTVLRSYTDEQQALNGYSEKFALLRSGQLVADELSFCATDPDDEYASVAVYVKDGRAYLYAGNQSAQAVGDSVKGISVGAFPVQRENQWGYLSIDGTALCGCQYAQATTCLNYKGVLYAWVNNGTVWFCIALNNSIITVEPEEADEPADETSHQASWPSQTLNGVGLSMGTNTPSNGRWQSYCGPSRNYHGAGGYKPYKVESISGLFIEDGFVLADMNYTTIGHRRVYFPASVFTNVQNVPEVTLTGYAGHTTCDVTPRFGPGAGYDSFDEAAISSGTQLSVFFEENGYVFAEFYARGKPKDELGVIRAWLATSAVSRD